MRYGSTDNVTPIPVRDCMPFVGRRGPVLHRVAPRRSSGGVLSSTGRVVAVVVLALFVASPVALIWWL
jgi:hypothetical protein